MIFRELKMSNPYLENLKNEDKLRSKDEHKLCLIELNREERLEREASFKLYYMRQDRETRIKQIHSLYLRKATSSWEKFTKIMEQLRLLRKRLDNTPIRFGNDYIKLAEKIESLETCRYRIKIHIEAEVKTLSESLANKLLKRATKIVDNNMGYKKLA